MNFFLSFIIQIGEIFQRKQKVSPKLISQLLGHNQGNLIYVLLGEVLWSEFE